MSERDNLIYTPVSLTPEDSKLFYRGKQLSWWTENPLFSYNAMLISAYHGMDVIKNRSEIRDDVTVIGDSGGFQIKQNKLGNLYDPNINEKLTWQKVIEWQMNVCDIGITLDIPPLPGNGNINYDKKNFDEDLKISKENAISMHKYKNIHISEAKNPNFRLFNCIHGTDYNDMELWHKETTENYDVEYDGFAFSGNGPKYLLPLRLGFAIEHSVGKPYHILGVSSPSRLMLVAYANKYTNTKVYFDSSAVALGKMTHKYLTDSYFFNYVYSNAQEINKDNNKPISCYCPICSQLERPSDLWKKKTISGTLITLHNLYLMNEYTKFLNKFSKPEEFFLSYIEESAQAKWLLQCMEFLDAVHETDFETAWNLHSESLKK